MKTITKSLKISMPIILVFIINFSCNWGRNDSSSNNKGVQNDTALKQVNSDSENKQALRMLKDFYYSYVGSIVNDTTIIRGKLDSIKEQNCTKRLLNKISKQEDLEVDPFLQAQDANRETLTTLTFRRDLKLPNTYIVSYTDNIFGHMNIYLKISKLPPPKAVA
jgi:hypothetical protein